MKTLFQKENVFLHKSTTENSNVEKINYIQGSDTPHTRPSPPRGSCDSRTSKTLNVSRNPKPPKHPPNNLHSFPNERAALWSQAQC